MNDWDDRVLSDWLRDGPERGPGAGIERTRAATRAVRQRPWWLAAGDAWPPILTDRSRLALVVVALVVLASLVGLVLAGSPRPRLPAPAIGVAGNGAIAYSAQGTIYLQDAHGDGVHPFDGGELLDHSPTFSPDGTRFAFWGVLEPRGRVSLWVADADGSNARSVTGDLRFGSSPFATPTWSPDGTRLAFAAPEPGVDGSSVDVLYVVPADGSGGPRRIGDLAASRSSPSWSPDGRLIAFARFTGSTEGVGVIHPDGTGEQVLFQQRTPTEGTSISSATWAPDASAIAYTRAAVSADRPDKANQSLLEVWTLGVGEREIHRAAQSWWLDGAAWSPDGAWLGFDEGGSGPRNVLLVRPDGSDPHVVLRTPPTAGPCGVIWAPDATALLEACGPWVVVPVADPTETRALDIPADAQHVDWQRVAP